MRQQAEQSVKAWQLVAKHLEDRTRLVKTAMLFYKTAEEVSTLISLMQYACIKHF